MDNIITSYVGVYYCISLISTIISVVVAAKMASNKSFNVGGWVVCAIFLGWIAVIIIACIPSKVSSAPKYDLAPNQPFYKRDIKIVCPNCGAYATGNAVFCDMCGTKLNRPPVKPTHISDTPNTSDILSTTAKKTIPIAKIEKYNCDGCGELIDTVQCPWCGRRKK